MKTIKHREFSTNMFPANYVSVYTVSSVFTSWTHHVISAPKLYKVKYTFDVYMTHHGCIRNSELYHEVFYDDQVQCLNTNTNMNTFSFQTLE